MDEARETVPLPLSLPVPLPVQVPPHVLVFPLPLQGPVNSTLKLAELLSLSGIHVTFLLTHHIHRRLFHFTDLRSRVDRLPGFRVATISDGLSEDHPRSGAQLMELFESLRTATKKLFREQLLLMLTSGGGLNEGCRRRPVECIIADGSMGFVFDVAEEIGVPIFSVRTISGCCVWALFCLPKLIDSGEVPFEGNDLDKPIKSVKGTENFLRRRDLPGFCRESDLTDPKIQHYRKESQEYSQAQGLILNTFDGLEGPILSQIRSLCPNLYTVGPLHAHLKTKVAQETTSLLASSNSLWEEDRSCIIWLDEQPSKTVLYVSFGSLTAITKAQFIEIWHGLVNSGKRFLWAIRSDSVIGMDLVGPIPPKAGVVEELEGRGYIVSWAPQEEVLAHPSVGGFLTHSGWNSTLESVYEGVPMICWPSFLDQQVNSRFVGEVWKLGFDMKDACDRVIVKKLVRDLMEERRDEFQRSADQMAKLAKKCLGEGGSSYRHLNRLIMDIQLISSKGL